MTLDPAHQHTALPEGWLEEQAEREERRERRYWDEDPSLEHEPGCDGTGEYHGPHNCRYSGDFEAGCFAFCEKCA